MTQKRNRGRVADQERRWAARHPGKQREQARRNMAAMRARARDGINPPDLHLPSAEEAKNCVSDLQRVLGKEFVCELLRTPHPSRHIQRANGRHLIGWLWLLVIKQPLDLRHFATFGRFMRAGDGRLPEGMEDWSI